MFGVYMVDIAHVLDMLKIIWMKENLLNILIRNIMKTKIPDIRKVNFLSKNPYKMGFTIYSYNQPDFKSQIPSKNYNREGEILYYLL
jgi:hypothetical protein